MMPNILRKHTHKNNFSITPPILKLPIPPDELNTTLNIEPTNEDPIDTDVREIVRLLISTLTFQEITHETQNSESNDTTSNISVDDEDKSSSEGIDPRVTVELDILNQRNDAINKLEVELGVRISNRAAHLRFERAQNLYLSIGEFIDQIESFRLEQGLSPIWDRTLNEALSKVDEVKREKTEADLEVQRSQVLLACVEEILIHAEKGIKKQIKRAKPFYDQKFELQKKLEGQVTFICQLEKCVLEAKHEYNEALRKLETISNQIHSERQSVSSRRKGSSTNSSLYEQASEL
ncbi:hypothetical protein ACOME3_007666 [Neoechinorhynchus agilis]